MTVTDTGDRVGNYMAAGYLHLDMTSHIVIAGNYLIPPYNTALHTKTMSLSGL